MGITLHVHAQDRSYDTSSKQEDCSICRLQHQAVLSPQLNHTLVCHYFYLHTLLVNQTDSQNSNLPCLYIRGPPQA